MIEFTWVQLQLVSHAWGKDSMLRLDFRDNQNRDFDFARVRLVTSHKATNGASL